MDKEMLSGIERAVYEAGEAISPKLGEKAVMLFRIADGNITTDQAREELSITKDELQSLVAALEGKFVHIEIIEEKKQEVIVAKAEPTQVPIDVPRKVPGDPVTTLSVELEVAAKYGPSARTMFQIIDGKKDVVDIASELSLPLSYVDDVLMFTSGFGALKFRKLSTEEIKDKYGTFGVTLYNQHGRNGLLLFKLMEKYPPITALRTLDIDSLEAIAMYETIYRLLSPPYPLNSKQLLQKLLGKA